jgi:hypothetical protein
MTDEQIALYAECRAAMPSPMIRLRSGMERGRLCVLATRPEFRVPLLTEPRVVIPAEPRPRDWGQRIARYEAERAGISVDQFVVWEHGTPALAEAAAVLRETITRRWRRAEINVAL